MSETISKPTKFITGVTLTALGLSACSAPGAESLKTAPTAVQQVVHDYEWCLRDTSYSPHKAEINQEPDGTLTVRPTSDDLEPLRLAYDSPDEPPQALDKATQSALTIYGCDTSN